MLYSNQYLSQFFPYSPNSSLLKIVYAQSRYIENHHETQETTIGNFLP